MKPKRIVALRILALSGIIVLIVISLILAWKGILTNSVQIIGVGVSAISLISYIWYSLIEGNLQEIDYQLSNIYKPLRREIIDLQKRLQSKTLSDIDSANEIENFVKDLEIESIYDIDIDVMKFKKAFVGSPSKDKLSSLLDTIEATIIKLKKDRKKYEY